MGPRGYNTFTVLNLTVMDFFQNVTEDVMALWVPVKETLLYASAEQFQATSVGW